MTMWDDFSEEQRDKYNQSIDILLELALTEAQMMTIHQLRYEFADRGGCDVTEDGERLDFFDLLREKVNEGKPLWFMQYIEHLADETRLIKMLEEQKKGKRA